MSNRKVAVAASAGLAFAASATAVVDTSQAEASVIAEIGTHRADVNTAAVGFSQVEINQGCQSQFTCFYMQGHFRRNYSGNAPKLSAFLTDSNHNNGTSGMRSCGFGNLDYVTLRVSTESGGWNSYTPRNIRSVKWASGACSSVAAG